MKRKPQSFGDMLRTVAAVKTFGLFSVRYFPRHKLALLTVAMRSDASGKGRSVTYRALTEVLEVDDSRTAERVLNDCFSVKLLLPKKKSKAQDKKKNVYIYSWNLNMNRKNTRLNYNKIK